MLLITSIITLGSILFKGYLLKQNKYKRNPWINRRVYWDIVFLSKLTNDNFLYILTLWIILSLPPLLVDFPLSLLAD